MGIRRQAVMSLGNAFPTTALDAILPRILEGPVHLREAAVLATIPLIDRRVEPLLLDRLNRENEVVVRTAVERAMKERKLRKERALRQRKTPFLTPLRPDQRDSL
jgi:HEAT repeat protein